MDAPQVVVLPRVAVESGLGTAVVEFLDHPHLGHQFQIPIDRRQADFRQPPADNLKQPYRGRVARNTPQLFKNHLPLQGVSLKWGLGVHRDNGGVSFNGLKLYRYQ